MSMTYRGTVALITGASAGLGVEFARQWAERGADVVLVARRLDRLEELARDLEKRHGIRATPIAADLALPGAGAALHAELEARGIRIQTLINNAGFGSHGPFLEQDPAQIDRMIQLNVAAVAGLTRAFLPDLAADGRGALVTLASTAAYQPTPAMAVYGATKAFVLSLTEAIAFETRASSLRVLAVSPGRRAPSSSTWSAVRTRPSARYPRPDRSSPPPAAPSNAARPRRAWSPESATASPRWPRASHPAASPWPSPAEP